MATTYTQLQEQIAKLQAEAARVRNEEVAAVVARIRGDIATYAISVQDLFGKAGGRTRAGRSRSDAPAKYADGTGNQWGGRGPRPQWLRNALAAGHQLEEFAIGAVASGASAGAVKPVKATSAKKPGPKKAASRKKAADPKNVS